MLAQERQSIILEMLKTKNVIKITDIATRFDVSNETARRDLEAMQNRRLVRRVYGGAVLEATQAESTNVSVLTDRDAMEKAALGKAAAALVKEGDVIIIGPGTTMWELAKNIRHMHNLTVLTTSLAVSNELAGTSIELYVLGGLVQPDELCMTGAIPMATMQRFFADKSFISCGGATLSGGVSDYTAGGELLHTMIERANHSVLVANSVKFGQNAFGYICALNELNTIISDTGLSPDYQDGIRRQKMDLILVDVEG